MEKPTRTLMLEKEYKESASIFHENNYDYNLHYSANNLYSDLPQWEKIARATHYALINQDIYIYPSDKIIGRIFFNNIKNVEKICPDLDFSTSPRNKVASEIDYLDEFCDTCHFFDKKITKGHIAWLWDRILHHGVDGLIKMFKTQLDNAKDQKAVEFYSGVLIVLDAIIIWNNKHIQKLKELKMYDLAEICERVPQYPARNFKEAVQAYHMQHIMVLSENPYGGNSPGRLDYYLYPYLEQDLKEGTCTLEEAREIIDELFLRIDESVHIRDQWGITISIGGSHKNGTSAVNKLTYIMIESIIGLNITHPLLYPRMPKNPPKEYIDLCVKYILNGNNRAQILNDEAIIKAVVNSGVRYTDAVEYVCGGCMEVSPMGMQSDFLFQGWNNIPKFVEVAITGGQCLVTGKQLKGTKFKGLENYTNFEDFYIDFENELQRIIHIYFHIQDIASEEAAKSRPAYLLCSMLDDCLTTGRNHHDGGARYHNYGSAPIGIANAADSLFAIKKAVFDDKICTASSLVSALKTNYEGNENLRLKLLNIPKYGQENNEADDFAKKVMLSISKAYSSYKNRFGGIGLPIVLTFTFGATASKLLGAGADGSFSGKMVSHGLTPQSSAMINGITSAINSNLNMPTEIFSGGASTMWDFDSDWINEDLLKTILEVFLDGGGQIFQGNTTSVDDLIKAQNNPEDFYNLIVRVGGFSARFVNLNTDIQNDIIFRYRHNK